MRDHLKEYAKCKVAWLRSMLNTHDNENRDEWDLPNAGCQLCNRVSGAEEDYHYFGICSDCAEIITNFFWKAHAGEYLTWSQDREGAPERKRKNISKNIRWAIWERDNFTCLHCGSRRDLVLDHIHPWSKGGSDDYLNLQTLCGSCNSKKRDRVE